MRKRILHHSSAIQHALNGLFWVLKTQPNFQFHILVAVLVLVLGSALGVAPVEMAVLSLTIFGVLVCELINTAIETFIDFTTTEWKFEAKIAKDVSAAMVLTSALGSVVVGIFIFIPYIVRLLL